MQPLEEDSPPAAAFQGETRTLGHTKAVLRNDWSRAEIQALYDQPFIELLYRAATVHRMYWNPREVQQCTLLSIKTGGTYTVC